MPTLVNQFNPGYSYYSMVSTFADPASALAFPISLNTTGFLTTIGNNRATIPSAQRPATWQLADNLIWVSGNHNLKFGINARHVAISQQSAENTPFEFIVSLAQFTYGATPFVIQNFQQSVTDRYKQSNIGLYAQDTYSVTNKLTITAGLRVVWDSDLESSRRAFARLNAPSFEALSHDVNQPLNQAILSNQQLLYPSTPLFQWQPRAAVAYEILPNTVLRAGFGILSNATAGVSTLFLSGNPPFANLVQSGFFTNNFGFGMIAGVPLSAVDAGTTANQQFQSLFNSGALSCASPSASPASCIPPLSFGVYPTRTDGEYKYPYIMQWSTSLERQLGRKSVLDLRYVGNRGVNLIYPSQPNLFQTVCNGCFNTLFNAPLDPRFATVASKNSGAMSSYNALQTTVETQAVPGLVVRGNYTYSHCLDYASNGGGLTFVNSPGNATLPGSLRSLYGSCAYDVRHSFNGFYIYDLPFRTSRGLLKHVVEGWGISGTVFARGGLPISIQSAFLGGGFQNGLPLIFANRVPGQNPYASGPIAGVTLPGTVQWLNPNAFQSVVDPSTNSCFPSNSPQNCQQGNLSRNSLSGPAFTWLDLTVRKRFSVTERVALIFDTQIFNLFNHPNFAPPNDGFPTAGIPGQLGGLSGFGTVNATVAPLTGLLGAGLGGDSSVRMIAFRGRIQF
jgi:hypothetical protein